MLLYGSCCLQYSFFAFSFVAFASSCIQVFWPDRISRTVLSHPLNLDSGQHIQIVMIISVIQLLESYYFLCNDRRCCMSHQYCSCLPVVCHDCCFKSLEATRSADTTLHQSSCTTVLAHCWEQLQLTCCRHFCCCLCILCQCHGVPLPYCCCVCGR